MNIKSVIFAAVLALSPLLSQAGVVYEWNPTNNATPWGVSLQLEFDQATVDSGAFALDYFQSPGPDDTPRSGLLSLRYTTLAHASSPMIYSAADGGFQNSIGFFSIQVQFDPAGFLTGSISAGDEQQYFEIISNGALFTFIDANHDGGLEGAGCFGIDPCAGATGYLEVQEDVAEVAEPVTLGLLGLGGLGMMCLRRRWQRG